MEGVLNFGSFLTLHFASPYVHVILLYPYMAKLAIVQYTYATLNTGSILAQTQT